MAILSFGISIRYRRHTMDEAGKGKEGKMKQYEAPSVSRLGSIDDFTRGEGWQGNADSFWIFSWGKPTS